MCRHCLAGVQEEFDHELPIASRGPHAAGNAGAALVFAGVRRRIGRDGAWPNCSAGPARSQAATAAVDPLAPKPPHFAGQAKNVIFLFMAGAPSHLELFDNKPRAGQVRRHVAARPNC